METSKFALVLVAFSLLAVSAAARPCKTLFFITSTSYYHQIPQNPNPNFPQIQSFFLTTGGDPTRFGFRLGLSRPSIIFRRSDPIVIRRSGGPVIVDREEVGEEAVEHVVGDGGEFYSSVTNSIRDRTKDIMRVVGALLFGVGCGALTAATMYLIWSLFWPNRFEFEDSDNDDFDSDNDGFDATAAKKLGYVAIPSKVVDDDLKKHVAAVAPAPAKQVVKMTIGATIHTTEGLRMTVTRRIRPPVVPKLEMTTLEIDSSVNSSDVNSVSSQRTEVEASAVRP